MKGEYYADFDRDTGFWCVFHTDFKAGHAFSSHSDEEQAKFAANRRNMNSK